MSNRTGKPHPRHAERCEAFCLLFEQIFQKESIETLLEDARDARDLTIGSYAEQLAKGVNEHMEEIDGHIEKHLRGWRKNRISKVALTIMRISVYEMLYEKDIPISVSINEAVEIAKEYATPSDGSYVNGVLGSVAKSLRSDG